MTGSFCPHLSRSGLLARLSVITFPNGLKHKTVIGRQDASDRKVPGLCPVFKKACGFGPSGKFCCKLPPEWKLMGNMGQPAVLCSYLAGHFHSFVKREMGNVLAFLHSVDNEVVKIMKFFEFLFGDVIHVSAVGNVPEAVA